MKLLRILVIMGLFFPSYLLAAETTALAGRGEWHSLGGDRIHGTWGVSLVRDGSQVSGNLSLSGSNVFTGGRVSGTISGSKLVFGVLSEDEKLATFAATLNPDGAISGEWQSETVKDKGVWYGTLK